MCQQTRAMTLAGDDDQFGIWQVSALVLLWTSAFCVTCLVSSRLYSAFRYAIITIPELQLKDTSSARIYLCCSMEEFVLHVNFIQSVAGEDMSCFICINPAALRLMLHHRGLIVGSRHPGC